MATNYPAALDTTATLPASAGVGANLSTFPHSTLHGNADDAIIAVETELGVAPSDSFSTVKARLDAMVSTTGIWTSYTPTFTQSATITKTVGYARWMRVGRTVIGGFHMTATSAGTASNAIRVGLPVTAGALPNDLGIGSGYVADVSSPQNYIASLGVITTTAVGFIVAAGYVGSSVAMTIASGDIVTGQFMYEAAT